MNRNGWDEVRFSDAVLVNPLRNIKRGTIAPYIEMAAVAPFVREPQQIIPREFKGSGSRFRNGDTLFARITPCLENGKTTLVRELAADETGWGSTEFIVLSGKAGVSDSLYVYYLSIWDDIRAFAIQSMSGTSGRQRVDADAFSRISIPLPPPAHPAAHRGNPRAAG